MVDFSRLKTWLQQADLQKKNFPLYQLLNELIGFLNKEQGTTNTQIVNNAGNVSTVVNADLITHSDEAATLPQSRRLLAGTNVSFDDSVNNERTVNVVTGGAIHDYVVLSDGGDPPLPIHDGNGNFMYIEYEP